jgi:hypothetical protein
MMNAFRAPEALHIHAQDGEGNTRMIRYIREDIIDEFVRDAARALDKILRMVDRNEGAEE